MPSHGREILSKFLGNILYRKTQKAFVTIRTSKQASFYVEFNIYLLVIFARFFSGNCMGNGIQDSGR